MTDNPLATAQERMRALGAITLDDVAVAAAGKPGSVYSQVAEIEIRRRVAQAQIDAATAQTATAWAQRITAWGTLGLIAATLIVAIATYLAVKPA